MEIEDFYRNVLFISDEDLIRNLVLHSKRLTVEKGEILQNIGECVTSVNFLEEGLIRGFFLDRKGNEITDCFGIWPGTPAVSCLDLDMPSPICIEALENSALISVPISVLFKLLKNNPNVIAVYNRLLQISFQINWESKITLAQYSARERYLWFLEKYPGLIDRVTHKHIASFLGMTPVQLSRVRKTIPMMM